MTPAADGRPHRYFGSLNDCPMSVEPTVFPATTIIDPLAWDGKDHLGDRGDRGGVGDAGDNREGNEEGEGREELVAEEGAHGRVPYARLRAVTSRSIALMPTKGATIPPSP